MRTCALSAVVFFSGRRNSKGRRAHVARGKSLGQDLDRVILRRHLAEVLGTAAREQGGGKGVRTLQRRSRPRVAGTYYFSTHGWLAVAKIVSCQLESAQQQRREREERERDGPGSTTWRGPAPSPEPLKTGAAVLFNGCLPPLLGPAMAVSSSLSSSRSTAAAGCFCLDLAAARMSAKASTLPPAAAVLLIVSFLDRFCVRGMSVQQRRERASLTFDSSLSPSVSAAGAGQAGRYRAR